MECADELVACRILSISSRNLYAFCMICWVKVEPGGGGDDDDDDEATRDIVRAVVVATHPPPSGDQTPGLQRTVQPTC